MYTQDTDRATIDGVRVAYDPYTRVILWSDAWERLPDLFARGLITKREGGPGTYGHVDYVAIARRHTIGAR